MLTLIHFVLVSIALEIVDPERQRWTGHCLVGGGVRLIPVLIALAPIEISAYNVGLLPINQVSTHGSPLVHEKVVGQPCQSIDFDCVVAATDQFDALRTILFLSARKVRVINT